MLKKFEVKNFKNFKDKFVFDLSEIKNYEFNTECIKDDVVNKALIYGPNASGKSNLGLAIFDIISHLTDHETNPFFYRNYLNAENTSELAEFGFEFKFDDNVVKYNYAKKSLHELVFEKLEINEQLVIQYDRRDKKEAVVTLEGAETLNKDLSENNISVVKYVRNNTVLPKINPVNGIFYKFIEFVNRMLFFKSVQETCYMGFKKGSDIITDDITERDSVKNFESFLKKAGVDNQLIIASIEGKQRIYVDFNGKLLDFVSIASTGTFSLTLFYFWLQRLRNPSEVSFVFIDEFDASYHHKLSEMIVEEIKKISSQAILTTHNTSIMSNDLLRPDCYFIMDENIIKPLHKATKKELRKAHNLEKMYIAGSFNE